MSTFVEAVQNQEARTENGMKARLSSGTACCDLFFKIGAMRGQNPIPAWTAALAENHDYASRILLWSRDVLEGAGERQIFRTIVRELIDRGNLDLATSLLRKVPELGRFDDLFVAFGTPLQSTAFGLYKDALDAGNGLAFKWAPRKGPVAVAFRDYLALTPKRYRKYLVENTKVVETQMCNKDWDSINFNHVPSVAAARYKKAFYRNTPKYAEYVTALTSKDPKVRETVKINAKAIFPHDVLKGLIDSIIGYRSTKMSATELGALTAQWDALPNFVGDANILPIVDVSGSMWAGAASVRPIDVSLSLGLYLADKNKGKFKDTFLTFSSTPQLLHLKGDIVDKVRQMNGSSWNMSTNLHAAFEKILDTAVKGGVPQEEMPNTVLILSDMQFNNCVTFDDSAIEMIRRKYNQHGYTVPNVVFWNLNSRDNVPVKFNEKGVALVSGYSPTIMTSILGGKDYTPEAIMLKTILKDRYTI